jgi:hypothetical protein
MRFLLLHAIETTDRYPRLMLAIAGIWLAIASTLIRVMG